MPQPPALHIAHLTKLYGTLQALNDVSFSVEPGTFFGFLGPNGAGKTTTIHAVTGLANFRDGTVEVFGHDVMADYRTTRRLIGLVPQEFNFDAYLTIEQILIYEAGYFGIPIAQARPRAKELLDMVGLWHRRKDYFRKLSTGMKRRLLIARAMVHNPQMLILDEPTAGVDLELRLQLWEHLRQLNASGVTIFLTTHYIDEAERLCDHIAVIHEGRIVADDSKATLLQAYGDIIEVHLTSPLASPPLLQHGLAELGESGRLLRIRASDDRFQDIVAELVHQHIAFTNVKKREAHLEDLFLQLTGQPAEFDDRISVPDSA